MAYDTELADRIREIVDGEAGLSEQQMFGGLAFLINGNMAVSASGRGGLLLRVPPADAEALVADPHVDRAVMGGRTMDGWLRIAADGVATAEALERWVERGISYALTLPPKP